MRIGGSHRTRALGVLVAAFALAVPILSEEEAGSLHGATERSSSCPFCGRAQRVSLPEESDSSLSIYCSPCRSLVDVFQPDSSGRLRRPPWYLPLDRPIKDVSPFELWRWVRRNVRYVPDGQFHRFPEVWQLPGETYRWRRGDCEDSAILLADWLRALGHDAVVATGEAYGAAHAWVVLHHDDQSYILETTGSKGSNRRMLPLAELMTGYNPTRFVFDDGEVRARRDKDWTADYGSPDKWYKLIPTDR
jgi:hypothetical protein